MGLLEEGIYVNRAIALIKGSLSSGGRAVVVNISSGWKCCEWRNIFECSDRGCCIESIKLEEDGLLFKRCGECMEFYEE